MTAALRRLGYVSSEGGPLLLLDVSTLPAWGGTDLGDYQRICDWLDQHPGEPGYETDVGSSTGLVWDFGSGTADVFRESSTRVVFSHAVLDVDDDTVAEAAASAPRSDAKPFGSFIVESGKVAAIWSPGRGSEIDIEDGVGDGGSLDVAGIDGAGIVLTLPSGRYVAWYDRVEGEGFDARRCLIVPEDDKLV